MVGCYEKVLVHVQVIFSDFQKKSLKYINKIATNHKQASQVFFTKVF